MGWMRTLFLGAIGQNLEIEELRERLDQMRDAKTPVAGTLKKHIEALQVETHELKLRLAAVIKLLMAKNLLTAQEVASMIAALEPEESN